MQAGDEAVDRRSLPLEAGRRILLWIESLALKGKKVVAMRVSEITLIVEIN